MPLERYRDKRDFGKTPEPAGGELSKVAPDRGRFVVQRHRATRLHYDFRLEIGGVLVSWAVPKGPSLDPAVRRMAVHVEDHPIEYFDFEGVIPARQYGAGDVIVWDWGTWEAEAPTLDAAKAVRDGELKFKISGEKLKGRFTIVRTGRGKRRHTGGSQREDQGEGDPWLLLHKRDEAAVAGWDAADFPQSVKTGRTNEDVVAQRDAIWVSQAPAATAEIDLSDAVPGPMPAFIEPMLATLSANPFENPDWLFEIKWDGYRIEAVVRDDKVRLWTRNGKDGEAYFPGFLSPPTWIDAHEAIVDGEVVALAPDGSPDFGLLQERISQGHGGPRGGGGRRGGRTGAGRGRGAATTTASAGAVAAASAGTAADAETQAAGAVAPLVYQVFDLLYLDGRSLLRVPLEDRKRLLRSVLRDQDRVRYASHIDRDGPAVYQAAADRKLEGIIGKNRHSLYEPGHRSTNWLKFKVRPEQELVVAGFLPGEGTHTELGAVLVGVYEDGHLRYAGRVGSGIDTRTRTDLRARLEKLVRDTPAFDPAPERIGDLREARWTEPSIVIRAEFSNWTRDDLVRQASFKGFEPEKEPRKVVRERPVSSADAEAAAERTIDREAADDPAESEAEMETSPAAKATSASKKSSARGAATGAGSAATAESASAPTAGARPSSARPSSARSATSADPNPGLAQSATPDELEALERLGSEGIWTVGGEELKLTNLDKPLFAPGPDGGGPVTKRELIRYFALIAPAMLPHLAERALNLHRFPNGADKPGFWQKDIPASAPPWLRRWRETGVEERDANEHLVADRVATLAWLGNQAAFEIHAWTSRIEAPQTPTYALIDIDPGPQTTWDDVVTLAKLYRAALEHLKVRAYPKLTGRRGIQAWIPVKPTYSYAETSNWIEKISRAVGAMVPDLVSWEWSVADRKGRARLDYTQNASIKTLVAPYAVRPAPGAPVSAPIDWDELDDPELRPNRWTIRTLPSRVAEVGDRFAGVLRDPQVLPPLS